MARAVVPALPCALAVTHPIPPCEKCHLEYSPAWPVAFYLWSLPKLSNKRCHQHRRRSSACAHLSNLPHHPEPSMPLSCGWTRKSIHLSPASASSVVQAGRDRKEDVDGSAWREVGKALDFDGASQRLVHD